MLLLHIRLVCAIQDYFTLLYMKTEMSAKMLALIENSLIPLISFGNQLEIRHSRIIN